MNFRGVGFYSPFFHQPFLMITLNNIYTDLTPDRIYEIEESVYTYFCKDFILNKPICSPLRDDKNPSFIFFKGRNGKIMWHDFTGVSGDVIKFVMSLTHRTYSEALGYIYQLFFNNQTAVLYTVKPKEEVKSTKIINTWIIKNQPFSFRDFQYWNQYNISIQTLLHFEISACQYFTINNKIIKQYNIYNPLYSFKLTNELWKIYAPETKYFRTNVKDNYLMGYNQLPLHGELLIITKSMKDVCVLYELGYNSVSPQSESIIISDEMLTHLESRFNRIIVLFDNDETGIKSAGRYTYQKAIIPIKSECKDIADYIKKFKLDKTKKLCKTIFKVN